MATAKTLAAPPLGLPVKAPKASKSNIPTVAWKTVETDMVSEYVKVCQQIAELEARKKESGAAIAKFGVSQIIAINKEQAENPTAQIKSVKVYDDPEDREVVGAPDTVRVTMASTFLKFDQPQVEDQLKKWGKDPNAVLEWDVEANFNTDVFKGTNGKFSEERYKAFTKAVAEVAEKFGVESPLACENVCTVREDFATKRWTMMTVAQLQRLTEILPNKVSIEAVKTGSAD